jgi:2'-5' RNA ligase
MRLFAAITPPEEIRDHLEHALSMVAPLTTRPVWQPRSNWHVTLAFYGETPAGQLGMIIEDLREAARQVTPFTVELAGAGTFRGKSSWIGVSDPDGQLAKLSRLLRESAETQSGRPDNRQRNRAHLTVSRKPGLENAMAALSGYRSPSWQAQEVILYESKLGEGPGGHALYTALETVTLG